HPALVRTGPGAGALPEGAEAVGTPEGAEAMLPEADGTGAGTGGAAGRDDVAAPLPSDAPEVTPDEGAVATALPAPEAGTSSGATDAAAAAKGLEAAVAYALAHIGDVYALGGKGPHRWDCSGLVQMAYRRAGVRLPRIAADQYRATARIPRGALRRGDLVFWSRNGRASGVHHVAIYLGGDRYLEAARPGTKVRISTFARYKPNLYGRVRLPRAA
ncbi:C40 family peptidase, partial [Streptomyces sp. URMC 126]|uniref:C40 family peptidase n=1 Tax=Streptomyces sp. URMC 126 TaxID=3423401 RepID=UPI003F1B84EE